MALVVYQRSRQVAYRNAPRHFRFIDVHAGLHVIVVQLLLFIAHYMCPSRSEYFFASTVITVERSRLYQTPQLPFIDLSQRRL